MKDYVKTTTLALAVVLVAAALTLPSSAQSPLPDQVDVPSVPLQTVYAEDFAAGDGGFTSGGAASSWEFGTPSGFGAPDIPEGKNANVWGTNLDGNYNNVECSYLQSPAIAMPADLPGVTASMSFKHYTDTEGYYDGAAAFVSSDGVNWEYVVPAEGYDRTVSFSAYNCLGISFSDAAFSGHVREWRTANFDVTDFLGGDLHIRWVFGSDGSVVYPGWYVDQVVVQTNAGGGSIDVPDVDPGELPDGVDVPSVPLQTAYAEDFAAGDGGFTSGGAASSWEFGTPSGFGAPDIPEGKNANVWGTNLDGNYNNSECSFLQSPAIAMPADLPGTTATMSFKHYTDTEGYYDGAAAFVSSDGVNWEYVVPAEGYDRTVSFSAYNCLGISFSDPAFSGHVGDWRTATFDVTDFLGGDLHIRWAFGSDGSVVYPGWYVDQVVVQTNAGGGSIDVPDVDPGELPDGVDVPSVPLQTVYAEDFAAGDGDFTAGGAASSWEFGTPSGFGAPDIPEGKNANVWGTNIDGNYNNVECSYLQSPAIAMPADLPGVTASMSFKHYTDIESYWDGAAVFVSSDGVNWEYVVPADGYDRTIYSYSGNCLGISTSDEAFSGNEREWRTANFDVTDFLGGDLHIRWALGTDFSVVYPGWYIDQVVVQTSVGGGTIGLPGTGGECEDFLGWSSGGANNNWCYGTATSGPVGAAAYGTNLGGTYNNVQCSYIESPAVPAAVFAANPSLSFSHWYDIENYYDGGAVFVSNDGGMNWNYVAMGDYDGTTSSTTYNCLGISFLDRVYTDTSGGFQTSSADLSDFAGAGDVKVRFVFGTDSSVVREGWFVDNVSLGGVPVLV